jgi:tetratricopeptide (TPR) repeat protein
VATKKKASSARNKAGGNEPVDGTPTLASRESYRRALELFEQAYASLGKKDYQAGYQGFRNLLEEFPDESEVGDRARAYMKVCERHLGDPPAEPSDPEEIYLKAVFEMNSGRFDRALALYGDVLQARPGHDAAIYGSAVALAQVGRKAEAMKRLRESVEANPLNRILALNDPDFECVRDEPEFIDLVEPEESRGTQSPPV